MGEQDIKKDPLPSDRVGGTSNITLRMRIKGRKISNPTARRAIVSGTLQSSLGEGVQGGENGAGNASGGVRERAHAVYMAHTMHMAPVHYVPGQNQE